MSCIPGLTRTLRSRGFRMTPQRLSILQALHDGGHLSPAQIYERTRGNGLTETTVYRTLEFLAENGVVHPTHSGHGHLTYELAGTDHHHLVCRECGRQVDLETGLVKGFVCQLEQGSGYRLDAGHFTFFGLCPQCLSASD